MRKGRRGRGGREVPAAAGEPEPSREGRPEAAGGGGAGEGGAGGGGGSGPGGQRVRGGGAAEGGTRWRRRGRRGCRGSPRAAFRVALREELAPVVLWGWGCEVLVAGCCRGGFQCRQNLALVCKNSPLPQQVNAFLWHVKAS